MTNAQPMSTEDIVKHVIPHLEIIGKAGWEFLDFLRKKYRARDSRRRRELQEKCNDRAEEVASFAQDLQWLLRHDTARRTPTSHADDAELWDVIDASLIHVQETRRAVAELSATGRCQARDDVKLLLQDLETDKEALKEHFCRYKRARDESLERVATAQSNNELSLVPYVPPGVPSAPRARYDDWYNEQYDDRLDERSSDRHDDLRLSKAPSRRRTDKSIASKVAAAIDEHPKTALCAAGLAFSVAVAGGAAAVPAYAALRAVSAAQLTRTATASVAGLVVGAASVKRRRR